MSSTTHRSPVVESVHPETLDLGLRRAVDQMRNSGPSLSESQRMFLRDFMRTAERRHGWPEGFTAFVDCFAQAGTDADALALVDAVRAYLIARRVGRMQVPEFFPAMVAEQAANHECDGAQFRVLDEFTDGRLDDLVAAAQDQIEASSRVIIAAQFQKAVLQPRMSLHR